MTTSKYNDKPTPQPSKPRVNSKLSAQTTGRPKEGSISQIIGSGDDAKNSFIWITIRWSFALGALITLAIYARPLYCQVDLQNDLLDDIKSTWSIFMPVITLALGYSFGKGK